MIKFVSKIMSSAKELERTASLPIKEFVKEESIKYWKDKIDNHDCHLSPEDGCNCLLWREQLRELNNQPKSIIL